MAVAEKGFECTAEKVPEAVGDAEYDDGGLLLKEVFCEPVVKFKADTLWFYRSVEIKKVDLGKGDIEKVTADPINSILGDIKPRL